MTKSLILLNQQKLKVALLARFLIEKRIAFFW